MRALVLVLDWLRWVVLHIALVIIVPCKEFLDTVTSELRLALFNRLCVFPLLVVNMVRVEVVNMDVGHVLRVHLLRRHRIPVEVAEPRVIFQLVRASAVPDSVSWLPLQTLVHEVGSLFVPAFRNGSLFNRNLTTENLISDIFPRASFVGTLAHHALVSDNTDRKVIGGQAMVLTTHHFGCHVPRGSTGFACVVGREYPGDAEIG